MAEKKTIRVLIDNKVMTMSSCESEEYMQKVANYINNRIEECENVRAFHGAAPDIRHRLLEINIADDFLKAQARINELEQELKAKNNDLDDIKHDSINKAMMADDMKKKLDQVQKELKESEKKVMELQLELKGRNNNSNNNVNPIKR
ncbi:MAG: cell division protein ZapA [Lachnospiraceae bacterium]|nr:cell division protein ZapA [Lachnospiraceae bacterium]